MPGYNPYYPYPMYQPPVMDQLGQLRQQQFQPMQPPQPAPQPQNGPSIVWVQSENEALNYLVAPNCAVTLWDSNAPVVYLKQADASGKPSMKVYDLVERNSRPAPPPNGPEGSYATMEQFEALSAKTNALEAKLEALTATKPARKSNAKEETE